MFNIFVAIAMTTAVWLVALEMIGNRLEKRYLLLYDDFIRVQNEYFRIRSLYDAYEARYNPSNKNPHSPPQWGSGLKLKNAYSVLGLSTTASMQEVRNKFHLLVKKYHPDVNNTEKAKIIFKEILDAYKFISEK